MVVNFKAGVFRKTSGTQTITGVGFTPRLLIVFATVFDALNAFETEVHVYRGAASSTYTTEQRSFGFRCEDSSDNEDLSSNWHTSSVFSASENNSSSFSLRATLTSFNSDGFTWVWNLDSDEDWYISYIAIGGADITNAKVGHFTAPASSGINTVTGVGFRSDLTFLIGTNHVADNTAVTDRGSFCFGVFNAAGQQGVAAMTQEDNANPTNDARYQRTDKCLAMFSTTDPDTITHEASFSSVSETGFSLNYNKASGSGKRVFYVAIKGLTSKIGAINSPTSGSLPVTQTVSGLGLTTLSRGLILFSDGVPASTIIDKNAARHSIGAANSTTNRWASWTASEDNTSPTVTSSRTDNNAIMRISTENSPASSSTTQALADFNSFPSAGSFSIKWSKINTGASYQIIYVLIADSTPAPVLYSRAIPASLTLVSTPVGNRFRKRTVTAALTIAAPLTKRRIRVRQIPQALTIDTGVVRTLIVGTYVRSLSAALAIATNLGIQKKTPTGVYSIGITEYISIDTVVSKIGQTIFRTAAGLVSVASSMSRQRTIPRINEELIEFADILTATKKALFSIFDESLTILSAVEKHKVFPRSAVQTVKITSIVSKLRKVQRSVAGSEIGFQILTSLSRNASIRKVVVNQTVEISTTILRLRTINRLISQPVLISAALSRVRTVFRGLGESGFLISGPPVTRLRTVPRLIGETVLINTILSRLALILRLVSGLTIGISANLYRLRIVVRTIVPQSLVISHSPIGRTAKFFRTIIQQLNVSAGGVFGNIIGVPPYIADSLGRFFTTVSQKNTSSVIWNILKRIPDR